MPEKITAPVRVPAPRDKVIEEHVGRASTGTASLSVAHMTAPPGWDEPPQAPTFDEVTIVVRGTMRVEHDGGHVDVGPGETVLCRAGERVRYLNPSGEECEYWAVCAPAFAPDAPAARGDPSPGALTTRAASGPATVRALLAADEGARALR